MPAILDFILGRGGTALIEQVGLVAKFVGDDLVCVVVGDGNEVRRFVGYEFVGEEISVSIVFGGVHAARGVGGEDCAGGCYRKEQGGEGDWQLHGGLLTVKMVDVRWIMDLDLMCGGGRPAAKSSPNSFGARSSFFVEYTHCIAYR